MSADRTRLTSPRIISRDRAQLSDWVTLETISVARADSSAVDVFHALGQADYVHVLPMTRAGSIVLVRQYRPVIERWTLELPGGLRDTGENAETTAARELREETGFAALEIVPLIACDADVGRLCNRFFGFFALAEPVSAGEPGVDTFVLSGQELQTYAAGGRIASPGHIALLYLAAVHPRVRELCRQCGYPTVPWLA